MMNLLSKKRLRGIAIGSVVGIGILAIAIIAFVRNHPLVFGESFVGHEHCMKQAVLELLSHAHENGGRLPFHTNGYADAVMSMNSVFPAAFTGPGYSIFPVQAAWVAKRDIPESELGRVYIQGLHSTDDSQIAVLFDKLPTPGGDHCHGLARVWAPLVREVGLLNGSMERILEKNWPKFGREQIELLVKAGIPRAQAEAYYTEQAKPELMALLNRKQR